MNECSVTYCAPVSAYTQLLCTFLLILKHLKPKKSEAHAIVMLVLLSAQKIFPSYAIPHVYIQWFSNFHKMLE